MDDRLFQAEPFGRLRQLELLQHGPQIGQLRAQLLRQRPDGFAGGVHVAQGGHVGAQPDPVVADLLLAHAVGVQAEGGNRPVEQLLAGQPVLGGHRVEGEAQIPLYGPRPPLRLDPGQRDDHVEPAPAGQDADGGVGDGLAAARGAHAVAAGAAGHRDVGDERGHPALVDDLTGPQDAAHHDDGVLPEEDLVLPLPLAMADDPLSAPVGHQPGEQLTDQGDRAGGEHPLGVPEPAGARPGRAGGVPVA